MESLSSLERGLLLTVGLTFITSQAMSRVTSFGWYSFITWPGTVVHELLHLIMGILLKAGVVNFTVWPRKEGNAWVFGSVGFNQINSFNAIPVAFAPALGFFIPVAAVEFFSEEISNLALYQQGLLFIFFGILCHSSWPSSQDWKVALSKPLGVIGWGGILLMSVYPYLPDNIKVFFLN